MRLTNAEVERVVTLCHEVCEADDARGAALARLLKLLSRYAETRTPQPEESGNSETAPFPSTGKNAWLTTRTVTFLQKQAPRDYSTDELMKALHYDGQKGTFLAMLSNLVKKGQVRRAGVGQYAGVVTCKDC